MQRTEQSAHIIEFKNIQAFSRAKTLAEKYRQTINDFGKTELLDEMHAFQERREKSPELTIEMIFEGLILYSKLEKSASTHELRNLARAYQNFLTDEVESFKRKLFL